MRASTVHASALGAWPRRRAATIAIKATAGTWAIVLPAVSLDDTT